MSRKYYDFNNMSYKDVVSFLAKNDMKLMVMKRDIKGNTVYSSVDSILDSMNEHCEMMMQCDLNPRTPVMNNQSDTNIARTNSEGYLESNVNGEILPAREYYSKDGKHLFSAWASNGYLHSFNNKPALITYLYAKNKGGEIVKTVNCEYYLTDGNYTKRENDEPHCKEYYPNGNIFEESWYKELNEPIRFKANNTNLAKVRGMYHRCPDDGPAVRSFTPYGKLEYEDFYENGIESGMEINTINLDESNILNGF